VRIELDEQAWRLVLACLAKSPWEVANPLIMEIGRQMQAQTPAAAGIPPLPENVNQARRGNAGDAEH
jgi:hypothetical protein